MIQVRHNGRDAPVDPGAFAGLRELVHFCVHESGDEEQVVAQLRVDGQEIAFDETEAVDGIDLETVGEIEIETQLARDVALESLESSAEYAGVLEESFQQTADLLRTGRTEDANQLFATALDGFSVLLFAVSAARNLLPADAASLQDLEGQVRPWLEAVAEAQEQRDWLRVADYLEYELRPRLARWPEQIRTVRDRLAAAPS